MSRPKSSAVRAQAAPPTVEDDAISNDLTKYVTTKQAAEMLGVANDHVNRLLIAKKIKGQKPGHSWLVFVPSLEKNLTSKDKRGRPTSGTPTIQIAEN